MFAVSISLLYSLGILSMWSITPGQVADKLVLSVVWSAVCLMAHIIDEESSK